MDVLRTNSDETLGLRCFSSGMTLWNGWYVTIASYVGCIYLIFFMIPTVICIQRSLVALICWRLGTKSRHSKVVHINHRVLRPRVLPYGYTRLDYFAQSGLMDRCDLLLGCQRVEKSHYIARQGPDGIICGGTHLISFPFLWPGLLSNWILSTLTKKLLSNCNHIMVRSWKYIFFFTHQIFTIVSKNIRW